MEKPDLNNCSQDTLRQYAIYQDSCLNGVDELSKALMYASHILASDIYKLCSGEGFTVEKGENGKEDVYINHLMILKGNPKDKTFDQLMDVFSNFGSKIMSVNSKAKPQGIQNGKKIAIPPGGNPFEHVIREVKNGRSAI